MADKKQAELAKVKRAIADTARRRRVQVQKAKQEKPAGKKK